MNKQYGNRDIMAMDADGGHYVRHVAAMTAEGLHAKSDIAAELGARDWAIAKLLDAIDHHYPDSEEFAVLYIDAKKILYI